MDTLSTSFIIARPDIRYEIDDEVMYIAFRAQADKCLQEGATFCFMGHRKASSLARAEGIFSCTSSNPQSCGDRIVAAAKFAEQQHREIYSSTPEVEVSINGHLFSS